MSYDCFLSDESASTRRVILKKIDNESNLQVEKLYAALLVLARSGEDDLGCYFALKIFEKLQILSNDAACEAANAARVRQILFDKFLRKKDWSTAWAYPSGIDAEKIKALADSDVVLQTIFAPK
jgi:hypothetical protein